MIRSFQTLLLIDFTVNIKEINHCNETVSYVDRQLILEEQTSRIDLYFVNNNNHVSTKFAESILTTIKKLKLNLIITEVLLLFTVSYVKFLQVNMHDSDTLYIIFVL